jgi:hypothetical protein
MVNLLELELKLEIKDKLLVAFEKTNPPAKKPCIACLVILSFCRVSLAEY